MLRLKPDEDPWYRDCCQMTIASLCGFGVAAQFVSLEALEVPYYVALMGAGTLVLHSREARQRRLQQAQQQTAGKAPVQDWRDTVGNPEPVATPVSFEPIADRQEQPNFLIMN